MKKKILLSLMLLILIPMLLILCFTGCNKTEEESEETSEQTRAPRGEAVDSRTIHYRSLNFYPVSVATDDDYIADAVIGENGDKVEISVYSDGEATITVKDYWENVATVKVVVENSEIADCTVTPFSDRKSANIKLLGGGKGLADDTQIVQKAIDSLKDGGTLYFPAGTYKLNHIRLREGITLKLEGKVENVAAGYTDELAQRVANGEFAILKCAWFTNFDTNVKGGGNYGESNISIIGGMVDLDGELANGAQIDVNLDGPVNRPGLDNSGAIYLSRGENFLFENVIFKDSYTGHVMQLAGVKNATVKNCLFAGFVVTPNKKGSSTDLLITRETIQIEQGHMFACVSDMLNPGEFYYCENVTVDGCYFGDSDQSKYQLIPIGHHGDNGPATVTGLKITNNVFDNPYLSAVKFMNIVDVEITNNKFISEEKGYGYRNTSLIDLTCSNWDKIIEDLDTSSDADGFLADGTPAKVFTAMKYESDGLKNIKISDNEFIISGNSDKRAISVKSSNYVYGAETIDNVIKLVDGETYGAPYTGFVKSTNYASDIVCTGNKVSVSSTNCGKNAPVYFSSVCNLTVSDNTVELGDGISFSHAYGGVSGIAVLNEKDYVASNTFKVTSALAGCQIIIPNGRGGQITYTTSASSVLTLKPAEHMRFEFEITSAKVLRITVVCDDGYAFDGWMQGSANYNPGSSVTLNGTLTLTAKVKTA
ncbi:MAG: hypothetical protein IJV72_04595 [Clostridia bacterium]|nr:hypothetical protein [Clostridia bacterium]